MKNKVNAAVTPTCGKILCSMFGYLNAVTILQCDSKGLSSQTYPAGSIEFHVHGVYFGLLH